jgi:hypothetical protein
MHWKKVAIIGTNWIVFGSVEGLLVIMGSRWQLLSMQKYCLESARQIAGVNAVKGI